MNSSKVEFNKLTAVRETDCAKCKETIPIGTGMFKLGNGSSSGRYCMKCKQRIERNSR
jgi:hypothetical protein